MVPTVEKLRGAFWSRAHHRLPRWAMPAAARMMPGNSARQGPPRFWMRSREYAARFGAVWREVFPAERPRPRDFRVLGAARPEWIDPRPPSAGLEAL
jgi:hypothetical protein